MYSAYLAISVAMLPFPGKVSCAEVGGSEEGRPHSGHLNSLFCAMTLEETPTTDWPVNQLASLKGYLCGNRGALLLSFIAKSTRLVWSGEKWIWQLLLPSRRVCLTNLEARARAGKGGQASPDAVPVMQKWFNWLANSVARCISEYGKICQPDLPFRWNSE